MKKFFSLLLVLTSFSLFAKPKWISEPGEFCGEQKLCAVGEGTGQMSAETNAYNSIAKVFGTHVKSKLEIYTSSSSKSDEQGPIAGENDEEVSSQIKEMTDQVLNGVEIKETYETPDGVFALAVLNKRKGANILKTQMNEIDEKVKAFYADGRRSSLNKILKQYKLRANINLKYEVLTERAYPMPITYKQVMEKKAQKRAKEVSILVSFKSFEQKSELSHTFINALVDNDFIVVLKKNLPHQFIINGEVSAEKLYFNVAGFEKHKFHFKVTSEKPDGQKLGALNFDSEQIGRDQIQAFNKAAIEIKNYIVENLNELNID